MKTFEEIKKFNLFAQILFAVTPDTEKSKFGYAIKKVLTSLTKVFEEYNSELDMIRIDHALSDEKTKAILMAPKGEGRQFQYSKEGLKAVIQAESELVKRWNIKEFEVEPYLAKEVPELTEEQVEAFIGFVV